MKLLVKNQRGSVVVLFAVLLVCLLGFAGLVVDVGYAYLVKTRMQNAVDAAALAAAHELPIKTDAEAKAVKYLDDNGFHDADKASYEYTNNDRRIDIGYTNDIETFFMRVFGIDKVTVGAVAGAERKSLTGKYVLFSGSNIKDNFNLVLCRVHTHGAIHSNNDIDLHLASRLIIEDGYTAEAVQGIDTSWLSSISGNVNEAAQPITMPRLPASLENQMIANAAEVQDIEDHWPWKGWYILKGSQNIDVNKARYAPGNLKVRGPGLWTGKGMVIADGDINMSFTLVDSIDFSDPESMICFYSRNGDIKLVGDLAMFRGILYAPNGKISCEISGENLYGGMIGDSIYIGGALLNVHPGDPPRWFPVGVEVMLVR